MRPPNAKVHGGTASFDETATWTGSVVRGPDGRWFMYFTDTGHGLRQQIGLATSVDLFHWVKNPELVVLADPRWYETQGRAAAGCRRRGRHLGDACGVSGGPFDIANAVPNGPTTGSLSASWCRTRQGSGVLLAFHNLSHDGEFGEEITDPMPVRRPGRVIALDLP